MVIQNYRDIKARAYKTLSYTPWDIKKTVLIYGAVALGAVLVQTVISLLLSSAATDTGGLTGMATYRLFATASSFLSIAVSIGLIFWNLSMPYCCLMVLREQDPWPKGLLRGFRRWAPLVRYYILIIICVFAIAWAVAYVASMLAAPFMSDLTQLVTQMPEDADIYTYLESIPTDRLLNAMVPMLAIFAVLMLAVLIPLAYRAQLAPLLILDDPHMGARMALKFSFMLTKGSCIQLFRLDLSFWWYHILTALCTAIPYAAELSVFKSWGVGADLLFSVVYCGTLLGVYMLGLAKVQTAAAAAYDHLRTAPPQVQNCQQLPTGGSDG